MPLTDTAIRNAKPGAKPKKLTDGFGMYLEISPAGGRYWRIKFCVAGKDEASLPRGLPDCRPEGGAEPPRRHTPAAREQAIDVRCVTKLPTY